MHDGTGTYLDFRLGMLYVRPFFKNKSMRAFLKDSVALVFAYAIHFSKIMGLFSPLKNKGYSILPNVLKNVV